MSGLAADPLSSEQITAIVDWVKARLSVQLGSPSKLLPGQRLLASIVPLSPEIDVSELVDGVLNVALVQKDVLFGDLSALQPPAASSIAGSSDLDGSTLLGAVGGASRQPFPVPISSTLFPNQLAGLLGQVLGTVALPKLSVSVKVAWSVTGTQPLVDGVHMVTNGLTSGSLSALILPAFHDLNFETLANPPATSITVSATISLSIGTEPPVTMTLTTPPIAQLPVLAPTVVAMFSEPNFTLTEDSSVVVFVPAGSPFSSAAPVFRELQRIEAVLDELRGIASVAGFLLGLSAVVALTEAPRLRFVAADSIIKFSEITIKHKPWYSFFGTDPSFDNVVQSLFVFGVPGTKVAFYNDDTWREATQGYYQIGLRDVNPQMPLALPDFFVAIRAYPTAAEVANDATLSDRQSAPATAPPGRIVDWKPDPTGGSTVTWGGHLSSAKFVTASATARA